MIFIYYTIFNSFYCQMFPLKKNICNGIEAYRKFWANEKFRLATERSTKMSRNLQTVSFGEEGGKEDSATLAKSNKPNWVREIETERQGEREKMHNDSCTEISFEALTGYGTGIGTSRDASPGLAGVGLTHRYTQYSHTLIHSYMCEHNECRVCVPHGNCRGF